MNTNKYDRKLVKYLIKRRQNKIEKYVKKKNINIKTFLFKNGDSIFHKLSFYGCLTLIKKLSKKHFYFELKNISNGKLPCHSSVLGALERIRNFEDHDQSMRTILFLKKSCSKSFKVPDKSGLTAKFLFKSYKKQLKKIKRQVLDSQKDGIDSDKESSLERHRIDEDEDNQNDDNENSGFSKNSNDDDYNKKWKEKFEKELYFDQDDSQFSYLDSFSDNIRPDSWDNWANEIREEYKKKQRIKNNFYFKNTTANTKTSSASSSHNRERIDRERIDKFNEELKKKHKEEKNKLIIDEKQKYEDKCDGFFKNIDMFSSPIRYDQIPWPFLPAEGIESCQMCVLGHLGKDTEDYQKVLKRNKIRWHPDRFMHRCKGKLDAKDENVIMDTVKQLSQLFNGLSEAIT